MNRALGLAGLAIALSGSMLGVLAILTGILQRRPRLMRLALPYAFVVLGGVVLAVGAMQRALAMRDYSLEFVADHGSSATPTLFNIATMWSALEGSILLWGIILAGYLGVVVVKFRKRLTDPLVGWALITMFLVCIFFFGLMLTVANPFLPFNPPPGFDGPGPNPLLQNHILMAFHPPMLYLGYVGFTVPFAFAIGALATGRVGEGWLVETRRWTLFAWGFLTAGIILGSWWAYEVLGWGGYWGWDPVENASILPWITGTAFLHSVMVQERRGMLRVWNLSLVCATFSLTILGTFLTRSGVVESVHAFSSGTVGPILLGFFALIVVVSVGLIGWRGDRLRSVGRIDSPMSREGAFLANNVVFAALAFVILLGTVFPLIIEATRGETLSVGPPYFNRMTMPIGLTLLLLMAIAPVLPWRKASTELLRERLWWPAWTGVAALVFAVFVGATGVAPLLAFGLGGFAAGSALRQISLATRRQGWRGFVGRANGGMVVHLGVIMIAIALAASMSYMRQGEFSMQVGESQTVDGRTVTYVGSRTVERANRIELIAEIEVDGGQIFEPSLNRYRQSGMTLPTPSVNTGLTSDLVLSITRAPGETDPTLGLRVMSQPLIVWLWIGGFVMAFGTLLSVFPGRRRNPLDPVSAPAPIETPIEPGDGDEPGSSDEVAVESSGATS